MNNHAAPNYGDCIFCGRIAWCPQEWWDYMEQRSPPFDSLQLYRRPEPHYGVLATLSPTGSIVMSFTASTLILATSVTPAWPWVPQPQDD